MSFVSDIRSQEVLADTVSEPPEIELPYLSDFSREKLLAHPSRTAKVAVHELWPLCYLTDNAVWLNTPCKCGYPEFLYQVVGPFPRSGYHEDIDRVIEC